MKIIEKLAILVMIFGVLGMTGCESKTPSTRSSTNRICPEAGAYCTVQFRRDALGASADLPVPPTTGNINGAEVCVSGKFSKMNEDWVVITRATVERFGFPAA